MFKRGYVFIFYFVLTLFPLLFAACSTDSNSSSVGTIYEDSDPNVVITGISLPGNYIELTKSQDAVLYYDISAVAEPANAVNRKLLYSSSNPEIASIDEKGILTITGLGEFSVEVKSAANLSIWQKIDFYVAEKILTDVNVDSIPLSLFGDYSISQYGVNKTPDTNISGSLSINANKSNSNVVTLGLVFNGAVFDLALSDESFTTLSYEDIALKIKEQLKIVNHTNSDADIIISLSGADFPSLVESNVIGDDEVLQLSLKKLNDINVGQDVESMPILTTEVTLADSKEVDRKDVPEFMIEPTIKPSNATDKSVKYTSSDDTIATVNEIGYVTLHKAGNVKITAVSNANDKASGVMNVTVTDSTIPVTHIVRNSEVNQVSVGGTIDLSGTAMPDTATHRSITYVSLNPEIASINNTTGILTANRKGTAKIYAITDAGNYKEEYTITVDAFAFPVSAIMNIPSILNISIKDEPYTINPQAFPDYAFDKNLTYTITSGSDIITFDETTKTIKGLQEGTAVLTVASASDATVKKAIQVNVRAEIEAIEVSQININTPPANLYINHTTFDLTATVNEDANVNTDLFIESSDNNIVGAYPVVGEKNKWQLMPVTEGTAEIKVYSSSGVEQKFNISVHKVMNTKGHYKLKQVVYSYNGVERTFLPNEEGGNDNLQGEFGINVDDAKILFHGRLQLTPQNPLQQSSYTFNNWRFLYISKEIALDSNDVYAKQIKQGYANEGINITSEKTIEYTYTENGFQAHLYLEKVSDVYTVIEDKTIYMTDIDVVNDPHSLEGYYEMTWFYGNSLNTAMLERYPAIYSSSKDDMPLYSNIGITYHKECPDKTAWYDWSACYSGGGGENGSVTNYTGSFVIKVDGTNQDAQMSSIMKVQMQGHQNFNLKSWLKYIHAAFDATTISQSSAVSKLIVNKNLKAQITSNSGNEGYNGAYIAYNKLDGNTMEFEVQFMTDYKFMYRAVKVSDRYIDLPTAKYVDGDVSGRMPPVKPSQVEIKPITEVTGSASDIY